MATSTPGLASARRGVAPPGSAGPVVQLGEVLGGLSYALDLTEGQRPGHTLRSCLIGMRLGEVLGLDDTEKASLFYALLLKDLGCSSNAARFAALFGADDHDLKSAIKTINWSRATESFRFVTTHVKPGAFWLSRTWRALAILSNGPKGAREVVRTRCERGAEIAKSLGFQDATVQAIRSADEHWNGYGQPVGLRGHDIPSFARIVSLAQTFEVFATTYGLSTAFDMAATRRGRWFEPALVDVLVSIRRDEDFWAAVRSDDLQVHVKAAEPRTRAMAVDDERLDAIADAFSQVIDAKSPWTYQHSQGVADIASTMATRLKLPPAEVRQIRNAALLHDLGKLGVSNLILDKPGLLSAEEFRVIRTHPAHTAAILERVSCFRSLVPLAASHHERLDGSGYHQGLSAADLPLASRVLVVADVCDALRASRPYRPGLPPERVLAIMKRDVGTALDADCFEALRELAERSYLPEVADDTPAVHVVKALVDDYTQAA